MNLVKRSKIKLIKVNSSHINADYWTKPLAFKIYTATIICVKNYFNFFVFTHVSAAREGFGD